MLCKNCGTKNKHGMKFCMECGSAYEKPQNVVQPKVKAVSVRKPILGVVSAACLVLVFVGIWYAVSYRYAAQPISYNIPFANDSDFTSVNNIGSAVAIDSDLIPAGNNTTAIANSNSIVSGADNSSVIVGNNDDLLESSDDTSDNDVSVSQDELYAQSGSAKAWVDDEWTLFEGDDDYHITDNNFVVSLSFVSRPPDRYINCTTCGGTGRHICVQCEGTGKNSSPANNNIYNPGDGGLTIGIAAWNANCSTCYGSGTTNCWSYCGGNMLYNPAFTDYAVQLGNLMHSSGVNTFKMEGENYYIGIDICCHCHGNPLQGNSYCVSCTMGYHIFYPLSSANDARTAPPSHWVAVNTGNFTPIDIWANSSGSGHTPFSLDGIMGAHVGRTCRAFGCGRPVSARGAVYCGTC